MKEFLRMTSWQGYFFFFSWSALSDLIALVHPRSNLFIHYHMMIAFDDSNLLQYAMAVGSCTITLISTWTLFTHAFGLPRHGRTLFKWLLVARIAFCVAGHNYELLLFKSLLHDHPLAAWGLLSIYLLFLLPSYKAHYSYAFRK